MYCNNCGEEIKGAAEFCPYCGAKVLQNSTDNKAISIRHDENSKKRRIISKNVLVTLVLVVVFILVIIGLLVRNASTKKHQSSDITLKNYLTDEINVGDYITFGRYEQDNDSSDGVEDIEWRVLAKQTSNDTDRQALLVVSRYALDTMPYNLKHYDITWEICSLRNWLNNDFYYGAFTDVERNQIMTIQNSNLDARHYNRDWRGIGGNVTSDNVFLLGVEQVQSYFADDNDDRKCFPTDYALWKGANVSNDGEPHCDWWLRSPGEFQHEAMYVTNSGWFSATSEISDVIAVRPALWIYVD